MTQTVSHLQPIFSFKLKFWTYRLICTSKATSVSRSRGWCSMRIIVSMKVTLMRRRTVKTYVTDYMQRFFSTDYNLALYTQTMFWEWSRLLMCIDNVNTLMSACWHCQTQFRLTRLNGLCKHFKPFQLGWWLFGSLWGVLQALFGQLHAGGHTWGPALGVPTTTCTGTKTFDSAISVHWGYCENEAGLGHVASMYFISFTETQCKCHVWHYSKLSKAYNINTNAM